LVFHLSCNIGNDWKQTGNVWMNQLVHREKAKLNYANKLKERFKNAPEILRISRYGCFQISLSVLFRSSSSRLLMIRFSMHFIWLCSDRIWI
jgi:hypothetical protein